ncbi:hypothetical protein EYF80_014406 [Liparis tanakae]|uniref:Uncharacterized protein n=1 Tax=Liparis tanakae TaxID=230148 RepID=A0A4Z2IBA6_9TELE|nr:hypothetical protein EYF80_014406 [Liparis tanakae]
MSSDVPHSAVRDFGSRTSESREGEETGLSYSPCSPWRVSCLLYLSREPVGRGEDCCDKGTEGTALPLAVVPPRRFESGRQTMEAPLMDAAAYTARSRLKLGAACARSG